MGDADLLLARLVAQAGPATVEAAASLLAEGAVSIDLIGPDRIHGTVSAAGAMRFDVEIGESRMDPMGPQGQLEGVSRPWRCTCTVAARQQVCRHVLALAMRLGQSDEPLATREDPSVTPPATLRRMGPRDRQRQRELDTLQQVATQMDATALRAWLLAAAESDDSTRRALLAKAAPLTGDRDTLMATIAAATQRNGKLDARAVSRYAQTVAPLVPMILSHLNAGRAELAFEAADDALRRLNRACQSAIDPDGRLSHVLTRLQETYVRCLLAHPRLSLTQKAQRFVEARATQPVRSDGFGLESLPDADPVLLDALQQAALDGLEKAAARRSPHADANTVRQAPYRRLAQALADLRHDVDTWVRIESAVHVDHRDFDGMIDRLVRAERTREAIQLAENALRRESLRIPDALRLRLADLYWQDGLLDEAAELLWQNFAAGGDLPAWRQVRARLGERPDWARWRARAVDHLLARAWQEAGRSAPDLTRVVALLLDEDQVEAAHAVSASGRIKPDQRLRIALARAAIDPQAALAASRETCLAVLRDYVLSAGAFQSVADTLENLHAALAPVDGRQRLWSGLLAELRDEFRTRRALLAVLDRVEAACAEADARTAIE